MALSTLRIEGEGGVPTGGKYRIYLNDVDVTDSLVELDLGMSVGDVNRVKMTFLASRIDVLAEAEVDARADDGPERTTFLSRFREWVRP